MNLATKLKNNKEVERFFKFAAVGIVGALVDFSVFNFCGLALGLSALFSSSISFVVAVASNFILHRYWTFPDSRSRSVWAQMGQYVLVNLIGLLIRFVTIYFATQPMIDFFARLSLPASFPANAPEILGENVLLAIVIGIVLFWNFFVNRYWTYNDIDDAIE